MATMSSSTVRSFTAGGVCLPKDASPSHPRTARNAWQFGAVVSKAAGDRVASGHHCSSSGASPAFQPLPLRQRDSNRVSAVKFPLRRAPRKSGARFDVGRGVVCEVAGSSLGKETAGTKLSGKEQTEMLGSYVSRLKIVAGETDVLTALLSADDQVQCLGSGEECVVEAAEARPQPVVPGSSITGNYSLELNIAGEVQVLAASLHQPRLIWFAKSAEEENRYIDRGINACLAGAALAFGVSKFFTVDHDYWHGWTMYEILRYAPLHNWSAYEEALKQNPVLAKMMISGFVYTLGDWIAQCNEGKPIFEFDRTRMLRSGLVGFTLHGSLSHFYYHICEALFPFQGWWVVPVKVAFDQTIWSAFWNSVYFVMLGMLRLENPVTIYKELKATFFPMLTAGWKLWPFAHLVTFGVIPVEQRLLWVDCVEVLWVTILSMMSNAKAEARTQDSIEETVAAETLSCLSEATEVTHSER
eukprot:TRINITY_DN59_c0_g1_i1.p1 TRINITY_DN59_c0_g1~~TRINITY_DN59_c0_g1_i1.p1  ORF type:complete len:471 (-),score=50.38 TRINITY_DN59_c0_g1_i1:514-1926(-)